MHVYSVYNPSIGGYNIYESNTPLAPKIAYLSGSDSLGSAPEDEVSDLPEDSKYVGDSEVPKGAIVKTSQSFGGFMLSVAAIIIANYIFHKFLK